MKLIMIIIAISDIIAHCKYSNRQIAQIPFEFLTALLTWQRLEYQYNIANNKNTS